MARKQKRSLQAVVGTETYDVWTKMLHDLVPDGRTHRLAPIIAGMLHYALNVAFETLSSTFSFWTYPSG